MSPMFCSVPFLYQNVELPNAPLLKIVTLCCFPNPWSGKSWALPLPCKTRHLMLVSGWEFQLAEGLLSHQGHISQLVHCPTQPSQSL